jgi:ABC-type transport system involved in multi-copper enzyme maturation permease subunit
MLKEIIKKELINNIYTLRFLILSIISLIIFPLSIFLGSKMYVNDLKNVSRAKILFKNEVTAKETWREIADTEYKIAIPPVPLQIIIKGVTSSLGKTVSIVFGQDPKLEDSDYDTNPFLSIYGSLDFDFIFKLILSLFAIIFSYDLVAGEKELGTLKQILANSVERSSLILGKVIGGYITLIIPILISIIPGFLLLLAFRINFGYEEVRIIFLVLFISFIYLLLFFIIGILISASTSKGSVSLLILLMIWVITIFIIPYLSKELGSFIYPVESQSEINIQKDSLRKEIVKKYKDIFENWEKLHPNQAPSAELAEQLYKGASDEILDANNKINDEWTKKKINQIRFITFLSRLSPAHCFSLSAMNLSNTGFERYLKVVNSISKYKDNYYNFIRKKVSQEEVDKLRADLGLIKPQKSIINFNEFPDYENFFIKDDLSESIEKSILDILLLFLYLLIFFSIGYFKFLKYDVR